MLRWLVVLVCLSVAPVWGAESFAPKDLPNQKLKYQTETSTDQTLTIAGMGLETKANTFLTTSYSSGARQGDGSLELTEKHDVMQTNMQLPGGLSMQFDSANADKPAENPLLEPLAKILRVTYKTPVVTVIDDKHQIREVKFPADALADLPDEFKTMFDADKRKKAAQQQRDVFPKEPVNAGDAWERTADADLGGGQTLTVTSRMEYKGPVDQNGRKLHRIATTPKTVSYTMDQNAASPLKITGSELKVSEGEGEILFDTEAGITEQRSSRIRITGSLKMTINGMELPGSLDLTIKEKTVRQP